MATPPSVSKHVCTFTNSIHTSSWSMRERWILCMVGCVNLRPCISPEVWPSQAIYFPVHPRSRPRHCSISQARPDRANITLYSIHCPSQRCSLLWISSHVLAISEDPYCRAHTRQSSDDHSSVGDGHGNALPYLRESHQLYSAVPLRFWPLRLRVD